MQETLELKDRNLDIPDINASVLNNSNEFLIKLRDFNREYDIDIEVQNSGRWKQGTYDKFKAMALNAMNPRLKKARNIRAIFETRQYSFNRLRDKLLAMDNELKKIRSSGITFNDKSDTEGLDRLNELINNLELSAKNNPEIQIEISKYPWYNRTYSYNNTAQPLNPKLSEDGTIYTVSNDPEVEDTTNPLHLFINIAIPIEEILINIYHQRACPDELLYQTPFGGLVVGMTISVFDAIMTLRKVQNNKSTKSLRLEDIMSGCTYLFPIYQSYKHPFVSRNDNMFSTFGTGNTCFGDLTEKILTSIACGELSRAKLYLRIWSETYPKNNINPLNKHTSFIFGVPLSFKKGHSDDYIENDSSFCKAEVEVYGGDKQDFMDNHCSDCQLVATGSCSVYKDWIYVERELSDDETEILKEFADKLYKSNCTAQSWGNKYKWRGMIYHTYQYFEKVHTRCLEKESLSLLLGKYYLNNCSDFGAFVKEEEYCSLMNKLNKEFTVNNFIDLYILGEKMWYSNIASEHGIGIEYNESDYELEDSEVREKAIRLQIIRIRSAHLSYQRMSGVSENSLITYASKAFYL